MKEKLTFEDIRERGLLLYEYVRGSHAYGLNIETSDTDYGATFIEPREWLLGLGQEYQEQISDERNDTTWYAFKKYMNLLMTANPNMIETLFVPDKFVVYEHPAFSVIKKHREMFITKECFKPFIGYATTQIKKCRSLNKMFLNEQEVVYKKEPLDFCYTFLGQGSTKIRNWLENRGLNQRYCGLVNVANMHEMYSCFYDMGNHIKENDIKFSDLENAYVYPEQSTEEMVRLVSFIMGLPEIKENERYDESVSVNVGLLYDISFKKATSFRGWMN